MFRLIGLDFSIFIILVFLNCTTIGSDSSIEYTDLGKFQVDLTGKLDIDVPYYKPHGITQIPSEYFRAFVIHELRADGKRILPGRLYPLWWNGADDSVRGLLLVNTTSKAEYLTLKLPWRSLGGDFNNKATKPGLTLNTYSNGRKKYTIPYGVQEVSLIYSIRFLVYDSNIKSNELTEILKTEKKGVKWKLEWYITDE
jgi:hypothetical protein